MRTTSGYDWIWRPTRFAIYERDGWMCLCCGTAVEWTGDRKGPTLDHVQPLSAGGKSEPGNLVTLCRSCNSSKHDCTPEQWGLRALLLGVDPVAFRDRVRHAVSKPIDPERGRALCELYCPGWLGRKREKDRRRARRVSSEAPF